MMHTYESAQCTVSFGKPCIYIHTLSIYISNRVIRPILCMCVYVQVCVCVCVHVCVYKYTYIHTHTHPRWMLHHCLLYILLQNNHIYNRDIYTVHMCVSMYLLMCMLACLYVCKLIHVCM